MNIQPRLCRQLININIVYNLKYFEHRLSLMAIFNERLTPGIKKEKKFYVSRYEVPHESNLRCVFYTSMVSLSEVNNFIGTPFVFKQRITFGNAGNNSTVCRNMAET